MVALTFATCKGRVSLGAHGVLAESIQGQDRKQTYV